MIVDRFGVFCLERYTSPSSAGVQDVLLGGGTWLAVTRSADAEWRFLAPLVRDVLEELPEGTVEEEVEVAVS